MCPRPTDSLPHRASGSLWSGQWGSGGVQSSQRQEILTHADDSYGLHRLGQKVRFCHVEMLRLGCYVSECGSKISMLKESEEVDGVLQRWGPGPSKGDEQKLHVVVWRDFTLYYDVTGPIWQMHNSLLSLTHAYLSCSTDADHIWTRLYAHTADPEVHVRGRERTRPYLAQARSRHDQFETATRYSPSMYSKQALRCWWKQQSIRLKGIVREDSFQILVMTRPTQRRMLNWRVQPGVERTWTREPDYDACWSEIGFEAFCKAD